LIVSAAVAALLLAGMLAVVVYKTRTTQGIEKRSPTCTP